MSEDQDKFIKQARQALDQQSDELDDDTLSRLRQVRAKALKAGERQASSKGFHWFGLGGANGGAVAFVSVSILAVAVWLAVPTSNGPDMLVQPSGMVAEQVEVFDDMELLAATEELEFYEDIEFYYWLETRDAQS